MQLTAIEIEYCKACLNELKNKQWEVNKVAVKFAISRLTISIWQNTKNMLVSHKQACLISYLECFKKIKHI